MDKLDLYRQLIQELLTARAKLRSANDPIKSHIMSGSIGIV
ncbi:MAG: hypothetical protein QNJ74_13230 [Trichodesmium sp. MO_231.B1]|nr:hypothetical protein [Trichodesmium sp. MO_231.B1]